VLRPFPEAAIVKALAGRKNVIVLERTDESLAGDNPLASDIRTALSKGLQNHAHPSSDGIQPVAASQLPRLFSGVYGLGSRDFRPEGILGAYEFATKGLARQDGRTAADGEHFFAVGIEHPYAVCSGRTPSLLPHGAIAVRFHSIGGWGMITTGKNLGEVLGELGDYVAKERNETGRVRPAQGGRAHQREPQVWQREEGRPDRVLHGLRARTRARQLRPAPRQRRVVLRPEGLPAHEPAGGPRARRRVRVGERRHARGGLGAHPEGSPAVDPRSQDPRLHPAGLRHREGRDGPPELQLRMQGNSFLGAFFAVSPFLREFGIDPSALPGRRAQAVW
jgi:pyruvate-ferredoxin/flavodoxin oxidoreductase